MNGGMLHGKCFISSRKGAESQRLYSDIQVLSVHRVLNVFVPTHGPADFKQCAASVDEHGSEEFFASLRWRIRNFPQISQINAEV